MKPLQCTDPVAQRRSRGSAETTALAQPSAVQSAAAGTAPLARVASPNKRSAALSAPMNSTMYLERSGNHRVTPEQAEKLAETFGVVASEEPHLMPLIRSLLYTPLPPDWSYDGSQFTNSVTGETTAEHPARTYFANAIDEERERHLLEGNLHMASHQNYDENRTTG